MRISEVWIAIGGWQGIGWSIVAMLAAAGVVLAASEFTLMYVRSIYVPKRRR